MDFSTSVPNTPGIGSSISHNGNTVSSLSYHNDGQHLFVATEDNSKVTLIDAIQTGKTKATFSCEREGVSVISATHNDYCVLSAGKKQNSIQYWSLYDNKIVRKFRGHTTNVHDISFCPTEDMFLSSSSDTSGSIRLWNLQQAGCMAKLDLPTDKIGGSSSSGQNTHAVFDASGMVFCAVAEMPKNEGHYINLYDARNYGGGAFSEWKITTQSIQDAMKIHRITNNPLSIDTPSLTINKVEFDSTGDRILCQSKEGVALIIDGYEGTIQRIFEPSKSLTTTSSKGTVSCFTPDGKSVLMGNDIGTIDVYDIQSGSVVKQLTVDGEGNGNDKSDVGVTALACNPKYQQIASSSCANTCLWIW